MRLPFFTLFICAVVLHCQTPLGTVTGLATDPSSSSIPGVSVVLTNNDTGVKRTAATNGSGVYSFPDLAPGTYRLGAGAATVHYVTRSREKSTLPFA